MLEVAFFMLEIPVKIYFWVEIMACPTQLTKRNKSLSVIHLILHINPAIPHIITVNKFAGRKCSFS